MSRVDVLRSLVRSAAGHAARSLRDFEPVARARHAWQLALRRGPGLDAAALTRAVAHAPGVTAATVSLRDRAIQVQATFDDGRDVQVRIVPAGATFAPRGAKEIRFTATPPDAPRLLPIVAAVSATVAHGLWGAFIGRDVTHADAIVERDGTVLRVDLRSVPAVRRALGKPVAQMMELIELHDLQVADGELRLSVGLVGLQRPGR